MIQFPISAVVVSHNEGHLLEMSLPQLSFCKQVIVVDLESEDNTKEVSVKHGAELWQHKKVPIVEIIHDWIQEKTTYEWILITDPDEVFRKKAVDRLLTIFPSIPPSIGAVRIPWIFYFKDKEISGTPWGGVNDRVVLVNRERFEFTSEVHSGRKLKSGFETLNIEFVPDLFIEHHWMSSYKQLIEKHRRYLKKEGESRYSQGKRTTLAAIIKSPMVQFKFAFITKKGYQDFFVGFFLSLFWSWYQTISLIRLWQFQRKMSLEK
mgnify:CR=1 FL=1